MSFYEPCCLFIITNNQTWADCFNDWRHLNQAIKRHERSEQHVEAVQVHVACKRGKHWINIVKMNYAKKQKKRENFLNV